MGESRNALREGLDALLEDETDEEIVALREHFSATLDALDKETANIVLGVSRISSINSAIRNQARSDQTVSQVSLRDLIDECLTVVAHRLRDVSVEIDCPPEITVEIIRSQFGQVLMNLIANAADAMLETDSLGKGRIKISVKILEKYSFSDMHRG